MATADTFRTIDGRAVFWTNPKGLVHSCEGSTVHPGVRLLWTDCKRDVPANGARIAHTDDRVDCPACLEAGRAALRGEEI